jgi:aerobic carbon-monoxide dehydrogenase medium subunit
MKPATFRYVRAETQDQAVELLGAADGTARILAGGQSLIPALSARSISTSLLLDIMRCPGLEVVSQTASGVTIGAACRQSHIELNPVIRQSIPLLSEALGWVAMPQVRSRGTVVGCLAQANAGGEVPVVSLALDAEFNILLSGGVRHRMSAEDVYGAETGTKLPPKSLIVSVSFRSRAVGEGWGFSEVQLRPGHFALVCCAATLLLGENGRVQSARIAVGGLTASPYRAHRAEKALLEADGDRDSAIRDAAHIASAERPWPARTDLHATGAFREKAAVAAVARALTDARARCDKDPGEANGRV